MYLPRVAGVVLGCLLAGFPARPADAEAGLPQEPGRITGRVLDRADGAPIADVSVQIQDAKQTVKTDEFGRFALTEVSPGRRVLYVSVVGSDARHPGAAGRDDG